MRFCIIACAASTPSTSCFTELTVGCAVLDDPLTAAAEIDRVLALAKRYSRPVYIEIPRDRVLDEIVPGPHRALPPDESDSEKRSPPRSQKPPSASAPAKHPVILAGEELHRFRLQDELARLVHRSGLPVAATIMGKSVFPESDPAYMGVYEGAMGRESVRDYVEASDCVVLDRCDDDRS